MLISEISKIIAISKNYNFSKDKHFHSVTSNSKLTNKNTIFIYDKNSKVKKKYVNEAIKNKTPAIITNKFLEFAKVPQFLTLNLNTSIQLLLKKIYKYMPNKTIAITGTNGKTSVVWYISQILTLLKINNSTVGTLGYYENGVKKDELSLTTPAYEELYKYGSFKKKDIYIFEASSHALEQNRIRNYPINIAAITNISKDHMDYHENMLQYKKSKLKLFNKYLLDNNYAVINSRINNLSNLIKKLELKNQNIILFGKKVYFEKKENNIFLNINKKKYNIKNLKLNSEIELENLECAISCCLALKINQRKIIKTLSSVINPPGRFQKIDFKKKKSTILIDYAHTPEALERTLKSYTYNNKKPVLLFGCGGDRDKTKRKLMGEIANKLSSVTYITDDNPRNENPAKIRKKILAHCPKAIEIPDRKKAIIKAIKELNKNEILIIAGKGHENYQIIKNKKYKFDDYKFAKRIVNR